MRFKSVLLLLSLVSVQLFGWESHYLLTYQALRGVAQISEEETIIPESLDSFVKAESLGLVNLFPQIELSNNNRSLVALPKELHFSGQAKKELSLTKQFLMALRVNPDIDYPIFILDVGLKSKKEQFSLEEKKNLPLSTLAKLNSGRDLKKVLPGQKLSPLAIIATASEEPDHGLDFNLWSDNGAWYKDLYNFGKQPFGNPNLSFSSQAPFHMGFFHESFWLYAAGPFLKRCYPEYRINQFTMLARFAFATGHAYWGYRFLGLALHYLQDLTQVYHSRVSPDQSTAKLIGINFLAIMGMGHLKQNTTQILSNKHLGLESYHLGSIKNALNKASSPLLNALSDQSGDQDYGPFSSTYARQVVAKEAYAKAELIDELAKKALPTYLLDPKVHFNSDHTRDLFIEVKNKPTNHSEDLDRELIKLMRSFGSHTRKLVRYVQGVY